MWDDVSVQPADRQSLGQPGPPSRTWGPIHFGDTSDGSARSQEQEGDCKDRDAAPQPTQLSAAASRREGSSSKKRLQRIGAGQFWLLLAICQLKTSSQASEVLNLYLL